MKHFFSINVVTRFAALQLSTEEEMHSNEMCASQSDVSTRTTPQGE